MASGYLMTKRDLPNAFSGVQLWRTMEMRAAKYDLSRLKERPERGRTPSSGRNLAGFFWPFRGSKKMSRSMSKLLTATRVGKSGEFPQWVHVELRSVP